MKNEIKRNHWSRFLKKFNSANQYRRTALSVRHSRDNADNIEMGPFMGVALSKKGRFIDGVQFLTGAWDKDTVARPAMTIKDPAQIVLEKDDDGRDSILRIRSNDGIEANLRLSGEPQIDQCRKVVEKVAYSMFEKRGYSHGDDMRDWYEAEQKVRQIEISLTQ